jgi:hypothetical protein
MEAPMLALHEYYKVAALCTKGYNSNRDDHVNSAAAYQLVDDALCQGLLAKPRRQQSCLHTDPQDCRLLFTGQSDTKARGFHSGILEFRVPCCSVGKQSAEAQQPRWSRNVASWHGDGEGLRNASIIKQIRVAQTSKGIDMFGTSVNIERARSINDETPFQMQNESCE